MSDCESNRKNLEKVFNEMRAKWSGGIGGEGDETKTKCLFIHTGFDHHYGGALPLTESELNAGRLTHWGIDAP